MAVYARNGVRHAWLVDLLERTPEALIDESGIYRPIGSWRGKAHGARGVF